MTGARLAVIPARGGSKRLPHKNVKELVGKPMIVYTIEAALACRLFDAVVVSTDDGEIAAVAADHGAEVPFLRDAGLADDFTPVSAVTLDVLNRLDGAGRRFSEVAQLMANCPLRDADDIVASFRAFEATTHEAQVSVTGYGWLNPWWALQRDENGAAKPVFEERLTSRSQDLPPLFCPTGAIWWIKATALRREGTFHIERRALFELPWQKAVDIDDQADFEMAELLLRQRAARTADAEP